MLHYPRVVFRAVVRCRKCCRERNKPMYITFVGLTKAFRLVSRKDLFKILELISYYANPSIPDRVAPNQHCCN